MVKKKIRILKERVRVGIRAGMGSRLGEGNGRGELHAKDLGAIEPGSLH